MSYCRWEHPSCRRPPHPPGTCPPVGGHQGGETSSHSTPSSPPRLAPALPGQGHPRVAQDHAAHAPSTPRPCHEDLRAPSPPGCSSGALTPRAWRGTFWSQTGGSPAGFYLFYYFSLNICCQTSYRSKLLHSTTSHLLFRIGRIRRVEVKSKHRRAGKAPRCIA